jgi:competence protein ComFC
MQTFEPTQDRGSATPPGPKRGIRVQISDFLLPQRCLVCAGFGASLHPECLDALPAAEGSRCFRCWRPARGTWCERCASGGTDAPAFDGLRTPFRFQGHARRALLEAKFRGITAHLGPLAEAAAASVPATWRFDVVVPVPLAPTRERKRGFNQAHLVARHVAQVLTVREHRDLVMRARGGPPQASLTAEARQRNARGAYRVRGVPPPGVLVVDDVTTTGSTLDAIAGLLKEAGAERVYALAVARED